MIFIELAHISTLNQTNLEENSLTRYLNANHVLTFIGLQNRSIPALWDNCPSTMGRVSHKAGTGMGSLISDLILREPLNSFSTLLYGVKTSAPPSPIQG